MDEKHQSTRAAAGGARHAGEIPAGTAAGASADVERRAAAKRYIPALDGIRALAVIAVVLYHLNMSWAQGGFSGVTVFFALSGYLITHLLLVEFRSTGRIDLVHFWMRRVRRLVPATVTLAVVIACLCTIFNHVMLTKMRPDILPSLLFFNNWWQLAQNVSYFAALGDPSPLTHFWSLAIEEQFYVLWPPLLFALLSFKVKPRDVRIIVGVLAAASALAMAILFDPAADASRVYYGTDTRAFSLLLGALLALAPERFHARVRAVRTKAPGLLDLAGVAAIAGLAVMTYATNGYGPFMYRGGTLVATLLTLVLIVSAVQPKGVLVSVLSSKPFTWLGTRSYSIYLWHYPLLALMNPVSKVTTVPWWMHVLQVIVVLVVSELSYRFIETPFRHGAFGRVLHALREGTFSPVATLRRHMVPAAASAVVALVAVGGIIFVPATSALSSEGAALIEGNAAGEGESTAAAENSNAGTTAGADDTDADEDGFPDSAYDILMIGDSVSLRCVDVFNQTFPHGHLDAAVSRQFAAGKELFQGYLDQNLAGKVVVFALGTNGPVNDAAIDDLMSVVGSDRVVVFITTRSPRAWVGPTNEAIQRAPERHPNARVIDWFAYSEGRDDLFDGDGTHLTIQGTQEYIGLVKNEVAEELPFRFEGATRDAIVQNTEGAAQAIQAELPGVIIARPEPTQR